MSTDRLLARLRLVPVGDDHFRSRTVDMGSGRVFGGQITGQCLAAAAQTVDDPTPASIHVVFVDRGDPTAEVDYHVERVRDGRTSVRSVRLHQGGLRALATVVFSGPAATELDEQQAPPPAVDPETLPPVERMHGRTFLVRAAPESDPFDSSARPSELDVWFRTDQPLGGDPLDHHQLLAYLSDLTMTQVPFRSTEGASHGELDRVVSASRTHTMWFHRPLRVDEWLRFHQHLVSSAGRRSVIHGHWYDRTGRLVASSTQETLSDLR